MLANKVICPHCRKNLKTRQPLVVGKRVLCSGCGSSFAVRPDTLPPPTPLPAPPPVPNSTGPLPDYLQPRTIGGPAPTSAPSAVLPAPAAPTPAPVLLPLPPAP